MQRHSATILAADVVGYSRLMGLDEEATIDGLAQHRRDIIDPIVDQQSGRLVKTTGDGLLLEFADPLAAVTCAISIQQAIEQANHSIPEDRRIIFRMGLNLAEIIEDGDDILGDGVNIAARLEALAEPGGVLISAPLHGTIKDQIAWKFFDNGALSLKNIQQPIPAWSWPRRLPADRQDRKPFMLVGDFRARSDEETLFAEDLVDELTTALSRLTGMEVTTDAGKADYRLQGTIRVSKTQLRLSIQLVAVDEERQLWAERYSETFKDSFEVLDHLIPRIVIRTRRQVADDDAARLANEDLEDLTFEQLLSLSGGTFRTADLESWRRAGKIAERAVALQPDNFMALSLSGIGAAAECWFGYRPLPQDEQERASAYIREAIGRTRESDVVFVIYSCFQLYFFRRYEEAIEAAEHALALNPGYNMGYWARGAARVFSGDYDVGTQDAIKAYDFDIRDPYVNLYSRIAGYGYFAQADYEAAIDWFAKAERYCPSAPHNITGLIASQILNDNRAAAEVSCQRLLDGVPDFSLAAHYTLPFKDETVWQRFHGALAEILPK